MKDWNLYAPELHDFSDLRSAQLRRPVLRSTTLVLAISAVLAIGLIVDNSYFSTPSGADHPVEHPEF